MPLQRSSLILSVHLPDGTRVCPYEEASSPTMPTTSPHWHYEQTAISRGTAPIDIRGKEE